MVNTQSLRAITAKKVLFFGAFILHLTLMGCSDDRIGKTCGTSGRIDGVRYEDYCKTTCESQRALLEEELSKIAASSDGRVTDKMVETCKASIIELEQNAYTRCGLQDIVLTDEDHSAARSNNRIFKSATCNCSNIAPALNGGLSGVCPEVTALDSNSAFGSFMSDVDTANSLSGASSAALGSLGEGPPDLSVSGTNLGGPASNQAGATGYGDVAPQSSRQPQVKTNEPGDKQSPIGQFQSGGNAGGKTANSGLAGFGGTSTLPSAVGMSAGSGVDGTTPSTTAVYGASAGGSHRNPSNSNAEAGGFNWSAGGRAPGHTGGTLTVGGPKATAGSVNPIGSQDPDDYFSRLSPYDNLFKKVELRYREAQVRWSK